MNFSRVCAKGVCIFQRGVQTVKPGHWKRKSLQSRSPVRFFRIPLKHLSYFRAIFKAKVQLAVLGDSDFIDCYRPKSLVKLLDHGRAAFQFADEGSK